MVAPSPPDAAVPDRDAWGRSSLLWLSVSLVMLVLLATATWIIVVGEEHPRPPFLRPGGGGAPATPLTPSLPTEGLRLAGSGSNLPLTRSLAAAFPRGPAPPPIVHASIGSGGGVRALLDGVIDVALISRPLQDGEREQGLVATPYARVPVVVAAHRGAPDPGLRREQLIELYDGSRSTWPDGSPVVVLQRERGDSSHAALARALPGFEAANERAYRRSRWRVLYRDDDMREALADTRGSVGLFGQGALPVDLPIRALSIDGVLPSPDALRQGTYPFSKVLSFVTRGAPTGETRALIDFVRSETGRGLIERGGGLPVDGPRAHATEEP